MIVKAVTSAKPHAGLHSDRPIVFVVDGDALVRRELELRIRQAGWQPITFATGGEFLAFPRVASPNCLLLDVTLPDLDGLDLQQRVGDRTEMPVIFITHQTDVDTTVRAMKAGAREYLAKPLRSEVLLSAISFALQSSRPVLSNESAIRRAQECYASLSAREREVMQLVASGWLNKQICAALGVREVTVKVHRSKMMRKMKAATLPELVRMAATLSLKTVPRPGAGQRRRSDLRSTPERDDFRGSRDSPASRGGS
jgi:FixJ family two-component response regulator